MFINLYWDKYITTYILNTVGPLCLTSSVLTVVSMAHFSCVIFMKLTKGASVYWHNFDISMVLVAYKYTTMKIANQHDTSIWIYSLMGKDCRLALIEIMDGMVLEKFPRSSILIFFSLWHTFPAFMSRRQYWHILGFNCPVLGLCFPISKNINYYVYLR